jgi:hypothetical protein
LLEVALEAALFETELEPQAASPSTVATPMTRSTPVRARKTR